MKSQFYMRTAYRLFPDQLPTCFTRLDAALRPVLVTADDHHSHPAVQHAEHLCRRMAAVDYYASHLNAQGTAADTGAAAIEAEALLVGYMSSCKAVLDASAIILTRLFALGLAHKQQDFRLNGFRRELSSKQPAVAARYAQFHRLIDDEIVPWRDATIHRETPIVVPRVDGLGNVVGDEASQIVLALDLDANAAQLMQNFERITWVDPLHFHRRWRPQLVELCGEVCQDILDIQGNRPTGQP